MNSVYYQSDNKLPTQKLKLEQVPEQEDEHIYSNVNDCYKTFGEIYLCNENTFGEFFRIDQFNSLDIQNFQGTDDNLFVFFRDNCEEPQISSISK
jgi:hypothetical protein